eukprot:gnl/TRDRNA2_/TRDRNA2_164304_c0_seq1.p1 gnl/TRDRNA2_/TRDRNA2_164304_c0~~gnl/TRDRNA2_/TRDRNA2_164304_c0_seq1.p1  ORF type:complete len:570 (+),score=151.86 gnl/TRDRNA2_/TRDRNA2_164304_c0_seq1:53-1762(+)
MADADYRFLRWENALKTCMPMGYLDKDARAPTTRGRWGGDLTKLNAEAHDLPVAKQCQALDFMEEAPEELRKKMAPLWKYSFAVWHFYDAMQEAIETGTPLKGAFEDKLLLEDLESLQALKEGGGLEKCKWTDDWTWKMLDPMPEAGSAEPWNDDTMQPMVAVGRLERKDGTTAFAEQRYDKAYWHFCQGLRHIAGAPDTVTGAHAKLRADLYKNKSAAALKLGMNRIGLAAATEALKIDPQDEKAWYRKSCALEAMQRWEEAAEALHKAGLAAPKQEGEAKALNEGAKKGTAALYKELKAASQDNMDAVDFASSAQESCDCLDTEYYEQCESLVFIDLGIDSILAVDIVTHIQAEMANVPIPASMIYDYPTVGETVAYLASSMNAENDDQVWSRILNSVWRALKKVLEHDPLQDETVLLPVLSEGEATEILVTLRKAYQDSSWVDEARKQARRSCFELRPFLFNMKPLAMNLQKSILETNFFTPDEAGLRKLEGALIRTAQQSEVVTDLMRSTREALYGGPNSMWTISMEQNQSDIIGGVYGDTHSAQNRSEYMLAEPMREFQKHTNA